MVGPSSTESNRSKAQKLKIATALLVGVSMAIIAARGGASLPIIAGATLGGTGIGWALAWYVFPDPEDYPDSDGRQSFRR
jgi:hypothetical protein